MPAVNQIEVHPYLLNSEVRAYDEEHGIATEAWSPIAQGGVLDDPVITEIAEQGRQDARPGGPALAHPARRHRLPEVGRRRSESSENFEIFDFELEPGDIEQIDGLDQGEGGRTGPNPDQLAYVPG